MILQYSHILRLLYLWCRLRLLSRLFWYFYLQFIHCFYLVSLPHLHYPELNFCQVWEFLPQLFHAPVVRKHTISTSFLEYQILRDYDLHKIRPSRCKTVNNQIRAPKGLLKKVFQDNHIWCLTINSYLLVNN